MDKLTLAAQILCCPDCEIELSTALVCPACNRSFAPQEDGIISALPAAMEASNQGKDQLQSAIEAGATETIVLYERAFHDEQASYYDTLFADPLPLGQYYKRLVRHQIYSYVRRQPFVVDLCCGTGKSSMPLVERGLWVVGMDVSREMLHAYKRKCEAGGRQNVLLVHADATRPPLLRQSCGAITMIGGLHHIPERAESVGYCCNAMAENGVLIFHEPLKTGQTSRLAVLLENLYAITDPSRVVRAIGRRIGLGQKNRAQPVQHPPDFTPYERPFTSAEELLALLPPQMEIVALRSQGLLSFREFSPYLQGRIGAPLAAVIVKLDDWLSKNGTDWSGDALFAVFKKRSAG